MITQRLVQAGVTTNQVQVLWLKQALASPVNYGGFPSHAQALQNQLALILRNAKRKFPNLKLAYLSCRTRAYVSGPLISAPPAAVSTTNYLEAGAWTNQRARYFQIRLGP